MCFDPISLGAIFLGSAVAGAGTATTLGVAAVVGGATAVGGTAATAGLFGFGGALTAGGAFGAFSALSGVFGNIVDAQARQAQLRYQSQVARNNQIIAERQAVDALERGRIAEARARVDAAQLGGRQRVALAASGQLVGRGSALDITSDTAFLGELDALTIRDNAQREALGFRQDAANFGGERRLARAARGNAGLAAAISSFSSLATQGSVLSRRFTANRRLGVRASLFG